MVDDVDRDMYGLLVDGNEVMVRLRESVGERFEESLDR